MTTQEQIKYLADKFDKLWVIIAKRDEYFIDPDKAEELHKCKVDLSNFEEKGDSVVPLWDYEALLSQSHEKDKRIAELERIMRNQKAFEESQKNWRARSEQLEKQLVSLKLKWTKKEPAFKDQTYFWIECRTHADEQNFRHFKELVKIVVTTSGEVWLHSLKHRPMPIQEYYQTLIVTRWAGPIPEPVEGDV